MLCSEVPTSAFQSGVGMASECKLFVRLPSTEVKNAWSFSRTRIKFLVRS
jgi:hypothetical protein